MKTLLLIVFAALLTLVLGCIAKAGEAKLLRGGVHGTKTQVGVTSMATKAHSFPVVKTDAEWRAQLTPEQYYVTREKGTERASSGTYVHTKTPGIYTCVCCGQEFFDSNAKYESGTGWPSFYQPVSPEAVVEQPDHSVFARRTEVLCSRCGAHLGHVFQDGPPPTGLRYCINSAALQLVPEPAEKPTDAADPEPTDH